MCVHHQRFVIPLYNMLSVAALETQPYKLIM